MEAAGDGGNFPHVEQQRKEEAEAGGDVQAFRRPEPHFRLEKFRQLTVLGQGIGNVVAAEDAGVQGRGNGKQGADGDEEKAEIPQEGALLEQYDFFCL